MLCNYEEGANVDAPALRISSLDNFNCDGECIEELDCFGECGGEAVEDECGVCNGDGSSCADPDVYLSFDGESLNYSSSVDITVSV